MQSDFEKPIHTKDAGAQRTVHPFGPVSDANSRVLILGSFPSVRSRAEGFYYGHPQNRFWPLLAALFEEPLPETVQQKKLLILSHHLALWDVIGSCEILGSSDASIRRAAVNDLRPLMDKSPIRKIVCNGRTAWDLYTKHAGPLIGREAVCLPSTSAANAAWSMERLVQAWKGPLRCQGHTKVGFRANSPLSIRRF